MGKNGGARPGAGRPPKIQEIKLIEQMDALAVPEQIWNALLMKCAQGDTNAIKLWLSYRFGLPKQQIDVTSNGEKIAPPIQWIGRQVAIEAEKVVNDSDHQDSDHLDYQDLNSSDNLDIKKQVRQDYQALINQDNQDKQDNQFDIWL
jgi:hypothetical protein